VVGAPGPWPPGPSKSGPAISTLFCSFVFLYNFHIAVKNVLLLVPGVYQADETANDM